LNLDIRAYKLDFC